MDKLLVSTSKFLSLVLRHRPEVIGICLDENGWAEIDQLIEGARSSGKQLTHSLIQRAVRENDKQRFTISEDGTRIRANQGHSVRVDLELTPTDPPEVLYHGTVDRFLSSIMSDGLKPGTRQHVHLSPDRKTAEKVGARRGAPIVLTIRSGDMHRDGVPFFRSANGVWLTDHVPAKYLHLPSEE